MVYTCSTSRAAGHDDRTVYPVFLLSTCTSI